MKVFRILANREIRHLFLLISLIMALFLLLAELCFLFLYQRFSPWIALLTLAAAIALWTSCCRYFIRQDRIMEHAVSQIDSFLSGNARARIECDEEGELYRLFHCVNSLATVLNAQAANELREKEFLKNTMSDISHQLKTPLAALNIYNGLMQEEAKDWPAMEEFAALSEQELDRIEALVKNLLTIARMDAGSISLEKTSENLAEMMRNIQLHFAYRAKQEQKQIVLSGPNEVSLFCDRDWLTEAIDNLVKNALDHTQKGDTVRMEWRALRNLVQVCIRDNGSGIHPEDLHHIFKRFYRSRFSKDRQGIGLGLPLAKMIIEAHSGTIEVDSTPGAGTVFTINFLIPTKL